MTGNRRVIGGRERAAILATGLFVTMVGGLATAATISAALEDGPARPDREYAHSLFVGFYTWGAAAGVITAIVLWTLVRRWRGARHATSPALIATSVIVLLVVFVLWVVCLGALSAD